MKKVISYMEQCHSMCVCIKGLQCWGTNRFETWLPVYKKIE